MNDANLATIYKKGPTDRPENYRPIALLNITYKILAIISHVRLCDSLDNKVDPAQFGFRKKKSTAQPLFIYRRLREIQEESGSSFHTLLFDWEKAFDKVDQTRMIQAIRRLGVKENIINMIEAIYKEPKFTIKEGKTTTVPRRQLTGIRQGCPLSPYLFILLLTVITHDVKHDLNLEEQIIVNAGKLHNVDLTELYYADDTLIMASTAAAAETILHHIEHESGKYNMILNRTKCIHLRLNDLERITYMNGTEVPRTGSNLSRQKKLFERQLQNKNLTHNL